MNSISLRILKKVARFGEVSLADAKSMGALLANVSG
jgi:hypothetical protein